MSQEHPQHLYDQLIKLGDMMGDGLHYEPGGAWITREYKKLTKILCPDIKEAEALKRKQKNEWVDNKVKLFLENKKCTCGGHLTQSRSGSKILHCTVCNGRFKIVTKKAAQ